MEEPPDGLSNSVYLGQESPSVRGDGLEPCLSLKRDVGEFALQLLHSILNLLLEFGVVSFRQFLTFPGRVLLDLGFPVVDI